MRLCRLRKIISFNGVYPREIYRCDIRRSSAALDNRLRYPRLWLRIDHRIDVGLPSPDLQLWSLRRCFGSNFSGCDWSGRWVFRFEVVAILLRRSSSGRCDTSSSSIHRIQCLGWVQVIRSSRFRSSRIHVVGSRCLIVAIAQQMVGSSISGSE